MLRRTRPRWSAPNPFTVLKLSPTASKDEVKAKYRELAKRYHPDNPDGCKKTMEQVNRAYNTLIKEGGYEKMHVPKSSSREAREYFSKLSRLDVETERVRPEGGFTYKDSQTGKWEKTDEPLTGEKRRPRYASFASQHQKGQELAEELRKKAMEEQEKREGKKTWFQRFLKRYDDSLPSQNPLLIAVSLVLYAGAVYYGYAKVADFNVKWDVKKDHYGSVRRRRERVDEVYPYFKDEMHTTAVVAAAIYLAAAAQKNEADPIVPSGEDPLMAKPTPQFYKVMAGA